jgi:DNA invertase Pin-like site-specific DNA recombinase
MTRVIGYTRELFAGAGVTVDVEELESAGATQVFVDLASVDARKRPGLAECLRILEAGDVLVVTSSARLSHSLTHFVLTTTALAARSVLFRSVAEPALTSGIGHVSDPVEVLCALDGLTRRLRSLETREGMKDAAAEGRRAGRPTVMTQERVAIALELRNQGRSLPQIGRVLGVSTSAVQRALSQPAPPPVLPA